MFKKFDKIKQKLTERESGQTPQPPSQFHPSNPYSEPPVNQGYPSRYPEQYQPPPGPPPSWNAPAAGYNAPGQYQPPPGPPPSHQYPQQPGPSWDPPAHHDWTVIPDTSLLPPPPSIGYETSPTANASEEEAGRANQWVQANPLWTPRHLTPGQHDAVQNAQLSLLKAPTYVGNLIPQQQPGHWKCRTDAGCKDSCILTNLPMYSEMWDSPLRTRLAKTIYFELRVLAIRGGTSLEEADAGIAIGFTAPPYPTFRLPGWHRGSLAVHGDDGRKYVNNTFGGSDFTTAFQSNETVGIGIRFAPPQNPPSYEQTQQGRVLDIDVFFTRNGKREGGWDGNAELDEKSEEGTMGLRGECDLFPAIGVFGGVDFEVYFHPEKWLYNPY